MNQRSTFFVGNIESRDLFNNKADVIVCDGFTGNILLKQIEAFYRIMQKRNLLDDYFERFNYENFGGSPILGLNGTVVLGHGISSAIAIKTCLSSHIISPQPDFLIKSKRRFTNIPINSISIDYD